MYIFQEITDDNGIRQAVNVSNNNAQYYLTSAYAKDLYNDFERKHNRLPSSRWINAHICFKRVKQFCKHGYRYAD